MSGLSATRPRRHSLLTATALGALIGVVVVPLAAAPSWATAPAGVTGQGTAADPYLVVDAAGLYSMAAAINADVAGYGGSHIDLGADIDLAGEGPFTGLAEFSGVLDGRGHTISDIVYATAAGGGGHRGLINVLDGGSVLNLTLDGVSADNGGSTGWVAGIAVDSLEGVIRGTSVVDADLAAPNGEKAGGLVAEAHGGEITDNLVQGVITANEMPAGVAAYANNATTISRNLIDAELSMLTGGGASGTQGNNAGLVVGYPGNPNSSTFSQNVALGGSIAYTGRVDEFVGRIVGWTRFSGWTAAGNLASTEITVSGATVTGPGTANQHGTDATPAELAQQATYETLGWDFQDAWAFDEVLGHPVPKYTYTLAGAGTEASPYEIANAFELEFLAQELNADNERYTGASHYALTGDLDFTGRAPFEGIDQFGAVLDGRGHTITGLELTASDSSDRLGLIRSLSGGTVRDLSLASLSAVSSSANESDWVAAVAVVASNATIEGVSLIAAELQGPGVEKVAGLAAELRDASTARNNWVDATIVAKKMPAAIAAYGHNTSVITENLVTASIEVVNGGGSGTRGTNGGLIVSYPGSGNALTVTDNVARSGEVVYSGTVPGFAGRIVGYHQTSGAYAIPDLGGNLANDEILVAGATVTGSAASQHGADTGEAELSQQSTYEELGWDFAQDWRFDEELGHPVPRHIQDADRPNRITNTFHGDSETRRGVSWYSGAGESGQVRVGTARDLAESVAFDAVQDVNRSGEAFYQAVMTGLEPGTRYYYQVGHPAIDVWGSTGTFVTSDGASDFTFIDLTDTQSQNAEEAALSAATIAKALAALDDVAVVHQELGGGLRGEREQDWIDLLDAAQQSLLSTTIAPAAGNHEQSGSAFVDHFALEAANGQPTESGAYYSFDYNAAHFAVLNTNEDSVQAVSGAQIEWLRSDVAAARERGAQWIIVSMHKGPYTTAVHLDDADIIAMREVLVPVIDELEIDLVLQGHDHVMSRTEVLASDPSGPAGGAVVETSVITEMVNGKRIEYSLDPEGTIYFLPNTAGAKHYGQETSTAAFDLEAYLQLFDRTGGQSGENFVAIDVTGTRLTVDVYDIRDQGQPRLFESFGIDREVSPVDALVAALPTEADLALGDEAAVAAARTAIDALSSAQQSGLNGLEAFEAIELRMRELTGRVSADASSVAWAVTDAQQRQAVTVRNDTRTAFAGSPVRVALGETPEVARDELAFFDLAGNALPYEAETWNPGGASVLWVRVPRLPAESATTIWAYFGTDEVGNDPTRVWAEDYALVEHFATSAAAGESVTDSTGAHEGEVVGGSLASETSAAGDAAVEFGEVRLQYPGDVGGQHDRIAISTVVSLSPQQLAAIEANAPIVAKESTTGDGLATFWQGIVADSDQLGTRLSGNSFEFGTIDQNNRFAMPADGEQHLITQVYDGMTYSVFIDGREVHSQMIEYRSTYGDHEVLTTIGDYFTNDGTLSSTFRGEISEVQIAGVAFTPDYEAFRHANLLGSAVSLSETETRGAEDLTLILGSPAPGAAIEAGLTELRGTLSERSTLTVSLGGGEVFSQTVDAGDFAVEVPLNELGAQTLQIEAESAGGGASASIDLEVSDTVAPALPGVEDTAAEAAGEDAEIALTVSPVSADLEALSTTFFADEAVSLGSGNTVVRTGSSDERTPDALTPTSGAVTAELLPTTLGTGENPYQIYEVELTEEQAAEERLHFSWQGAADDRRVSAYLWDHTASAWVLEDTASAEDGGTIVLDVEADAEQQAVSAERTVSMLIWRGLAEEPFAAGTDYTVEPDPADYDWGLEHIPDTQLYAQATPASMVEQFEYLAGRADERDTELVVHAGDWVNREYLSQEYQWRNAEEALAALEAEDLPYLISWGNHDYDDSRNGQVMLQRYFPMERFAASLEGTAWTFGGSSGIDNYYYTGELDGAELLVLTLGFFSADNAGDAGLAWAEEVIAAHPGHTVVIASHQSVDTGQNRWGNSNIVNRLIAPFSNVALVLGGHITGTGVASHERADGSVAYGILTDYQGRVYGGQQYLRHLSVDAENGLLYSNVYSPLLQTATSEGAWHQSVSSEAVPGFHGEDSENFVIELDLGGEDERTLTTSALTLAVGEPTQIGGVADTRGAERITATLTGAQPGVEVLWYADLVDAAGNATRSAVSAFTVAEESTGAPSTPAGVEAGAIGATIEVRWSAPDGEAVTGYEVAIGDEVLLSLGGGVLSAASGDLPAGSYPVRVRAQNATGWSEWSAAIVVEVPEGSDDGDGERARVVATGDFTPGGRIVVTGSGLEPGAEVLTELRSAPVALGAATAAADGGYRLGATLPGDVEPGEHTIVLVQDGDDVASTRILVTVAGEGIVPAGDSQLGGELSDTGAELGWGFWTALAAAALALALGMVLLLDRRRRAALS